MRQARARVHAPKIHSNEGGAKRPSELLTINLALYRLNKTALGTRQIVGQGITQQLAKAGAHLLVNDIVPKRAEAAANELRNDRGSATALLFDVTAQEDVARVLKDRKVDILVNNVGHAGSMPMISRKDHLKTW